MQDLEKRVQELEERLTELEEQVPERNNYSLNINQLEDENIEVLYSRFQEYEKRTQ